MNLCYLYEQTIKYPYVNELFEDFESVQQIEIETLDMLDDISTSIYIIEIDTLTKETTTKIKNIFADTDIPIYIIAVGSISALLYQLAYILRVKSIITPKQDVEKIKKTIFNNYTTYLQELKSFYVGKFIYNTFDYMIIRDRQLLYASETLMKNFTCKSLEDVQKKVLSKINIEQFLSKKSFYIQAKHFFDATKLDIIKSIYKDGEYLITIDRYDTDMLIQDSSNELASRLKFIELLKERLNEKEENNYSIITIHITNLKKISNIIGKAEFEIFIQKFLQEAKQLLRGFLIFAEYNQDFFVLMYKNCSFEHLTQMAQKFFDFMQEFQQQFSFKIILSLYILELADTELGEALTLLDSIRNKKISKKEIQNKQFKYIGKYQEDMSDKEIIELLFNTSFINDTDLQLLNIYKGLVISSPTKILRKEQRSIYVIAKQIQGAAMAAEKKTVLVSDAFDKNIQCNVAFIDRKRNIAKLESFKVVEKDEKAFKENLRVDFAKKTMARLSFPGMKISAQILQISSKNISLHVNYMKALPQVVNKTVHITFNIPSKRTREKEITIDDSVKVSFVSCNEKIKTCIINCEFEEKSKYKNILIEYIHTRQMEIVEELKKMVF